MGAEEERKTNIREIKAILSSMDVTLGKLCRNQTLAIFAFLIIMLVVLIQGQKISISIPGILEIKSALAETGK